MQRKKKEGFFKSAYARSFLKKYKWDYVGGILILLIIDLAQAELPLIVGDILDKLGNGSVTNRDYTRALLWMGIIAVLVLFGRVGWRYCIFGAARKIEKDMRDDLFTHLLSMPAAYFHEHKAGEIMAYMTNDIEAVRMTFAVTILMGMDCLTIGAATMYNMITHIDLTLSLVAVIPLLMVALVTRYLGREIHRRFTRRQEAFSDVSDFVQEKLSGIRVIKAFVQEKEEINAFLRVNGVSRTANVREARIAAFMFPFMRMITGLAIALTVCYGGYLAVIGRITVGGFAAFIQYLNMLVWPIAAIGRIINVATRGAASLKRLEDVMDTQPSITGGTEEPQALEASIDINHLTFTYPGEDKPVLRDINLHVKAGETLGIVGRTGAGKTTLVNLLLRSIDPPAGTVRIGGTEVHALSLAALRRNFGYVLQDDFLFSATVAQNIAFGDRGRTREEIIAAAEAACVHENIIDFADGYETTVGERGISLSGGQKQRISIARAILIDPQILILDDALSAVDTDTEEKIRENLKQIRRGKTTILIAQRLSTLQKADHIIVLEDGGITEEGTHEELLTRGGFYADLYQKQLMERQREEAYQL